MGRPVITTCIAAHSELIDSGVNGWLVAPGAIQPLADAMASALKASSGNLEEMGRAGGSLVARQHDVVASSEKLVALFSSGVWGVPGGVAETIRCRFIIILLPLASSQGRQFGVGSSLLLPLHQVGKLDSWEDFQDRQAMTLFTTRSTAGTTEPMSSAPTANGICSLAISPAPRHGTLSRSSATA